MEFEKIPSLIAVATFAALSMTVAHEWGYFGVVGTEFQSLFTTYDYVSELLVSLGPSFVVLLVIIAFQVAVARTVDFKQKSLGDIPTSKWGKFIGKWFYELLWGCWPFCFRMRLNAIAFTCCSVSSGLELSAISSITPRWPTINEPL